MTNEEAVKYFKRHIDLYCVTGICRDAEIMAIKALSQQTEYHGTEDMDGLYYCPVCQQTTTVFKDGGKCPKCGATMDELSTRAQQTDDAISRQAAIDAVAFGITYATGVNMETGEVSYPFAESNHELRKAIHRICELPLVTPKQRTGHWINLENKGVKYPFWCRYKCSECQNSGERSFNYCPSCGCRMVEPLESEE